MRGNWENDSEGKENFWKWWRIGTQKIIIKIDEYIGTVRDLKWNSGQYNKKQW